MSSVGLSDEDYAQRVGAILRYYYRDMRNAAYHVGTKLGFDPRTMRSYLDGEKCPRFKQLIVLMNECPPLAEEVQRMARELNETKQAHRRSANPR